MKFKLCAGYWTYWFFDKETKKPLTCRQYIGPLILNETEVVIEVPESLKNNENSLINIERQR